MPNRDIELTAEQSRICDVLGDLAFTALRDQECSLEHVWAEMELSEMETGPYGKYWLENL
jgi:hypothetical protein